MFQNLDITLKKGDKVAFLSRDTRATSALYDILAGEIPADSGKYIWGVTTSQSYLPADNTKYFSTFANNGYEGDLVVAMLPDSFRTGVLGETLDAKGFYVENNNKPTVEFALLFQFETDANAIRHCLYRCTASRPAVSSSTIEATKEPQEETITIKAMPLISNGNVKARANYNSSSTSSYALWFSAVQTPSV